MALSQSSFDHLHFTSFQPYRKATFQAMSEKWLTSGLPVIRQNRETWKVSCPHCSVSGFVDLVTSVGPGALQGYTR
jgi:hypothetical protein